MPCTATWMALGVAILREVSQVEENYCMTFFLWGIWREMIQMNLLNRNRLTDLEKELMFAGGGWGRGSWEFGMDMCRLLHLEWITSRDLLYSPWNSAQRTRQPGWGEVSGEWRRAYVRQGPLAVHFNCHDRLYPNTKQWKYTEDSAQVFKDIGIMI